jgi:ribosomal protein S18 acetylase RimI-like enzyme
MTRSQGAPDVTLTGFRPGAVAQLLDLWQQVMPRDAPDRERFRDIALLDSQFRPEGLALLWRGERLIGFSYAVAARAAGGARPAGWIAGLGVAPGERRAGYGTRLLTSGLRFLASAGCSEARLGGNGERYLLPGADPLEYPEFHRFIQAAGFRATGTTEAMACDLDGVPLDEMAGSGPDGRYAYCHPEDGDIPELLRVAAEFGPGWAGLVRSHLARGGSPSHLWIARGPEGIAGFGPTGVLPVARGRGIGGQLLRLSLASMAARGRPSAWFLWGPEGRSGRRMYETAGFYVNRRFDFFARDLTDYDVTGSAVAQERELDGN